MSGRGWWFRCAGAHRHLLDHGGDVSFWENGWLRTHRVRWAEEV